MPFRRSYSDKNGVHTRHWDKDEIDVVCVYSLNNDTCCYLVPSAYNKCLTLRVEMPKNNQQASAQLASDYLEVP
jgi:hypothetical protein